MRVKIDDDSIECENNNDLTRVMRDIAARAASFPTQDSCGNTHSIMPKRGWRAEWAIVADGYREINDGRCDER